MTRNHNHRDTVRSGSIFEPLEGRRMFAAGALDPSFSGDGQAAFDIGGGEKLIASGVAVQKDGKTVIVGAGTRGINGTFKSRFVVARLNFDGTLDRTFGFNNSGFARRFFGTKNLSSASAVAIQPDGKIVVAGQAEMDRTLARDESEMVVVRYLPNGTLDTSFDGDGATAIDSGDVDAADVVLQGDGKIVVVGDDLDGDFVAARLHANGSLDHTFGKKGKRVIDMGKRVFASALAINNGNIVLVGNHGTTNNVQAGEGRVALVRLTASGDLDSTFDRDGKLVTNYPGYANGFGNGLAIQPSGKIVVVGQANARGAPTDDTPVVLARYHTDGSVDRAFGTEENGHAYLDLGGRDMASDIVQTADGRLVIAGSTGSQVALAAFTANGVLDTRFGTGGKVISNVTVGFGPSLAKGPGLRFTIAGGEGFGAARFLDSGTNVVSVGATDPDASEGGSNNASLVVTRSERLPFPTRVFFNLAGTARGRGGLPLSQPDYTLEGMTVPSGLTGVVGGIASIGTGAGTTGPSTGGLAFVDIPANETFTTVKLTPTDNTLLEPAETAVFSIAPNAAYELGTNPSAKIDIADNDQVRVNFQAPAPVPAAYVADVGQAFGARGNGLTYGWDADNRGSMRIRNNTRSPDFRFDSLALMQEDGNRKWEIAVPNGMYEVTLVAGDPSFTDSIYRMNLENRFAISAIPTGNLRWFKRTLNIQVSDGRLTLSNAAGAENNKVAFIDIEAAAPGAGEGPITDTVPVGVAALTTPGTIPAFSNVSQRILSQVAI